MIRMIANVAWQIIFHETIRTVIKSLSQNTHVIGIHNSVIEAAGLPLSNHAGSSFYNDSKKIFICRCSTREIGRVLINAKVCQCFNIFRLIVVMKILKASKSNVRFSSSSKHGCRFTFFSNHHFIAADNH